MLLTQQEAQFRVEEMFGFILAQGDADYIGENVSQLAHSLQAAALAKDAGCDDETILGALLHDVGRFIPAADKMEKMICEDGSYVGIQSHEVVGEDYLRRVGFSEKTCQLVGAHVIAKRYLTAVDRAYYDGLSAASKKTLRFQGGPFTAEEVAEAEKDPWLQDKLAVRRFDDLAKEPGLKVAGLETYKKLAVQHLLRESYVLLRSKQTLTDAESNSV